MADSTASDMIMTFQPKRGEFLAECQLDVDPSDPLMSDFQASTENKAGNYFEITGFNFEFQIDEDDTSKQKIGQVGSAVPKVQTPGLMTIKPFDENKMMTKGAFAKWRSASDDDIKGGKIPIKLEVETFSFTRFIDRASPSFFEACLNSESFTSATLVKRVAVDDIKIAQGFLQIKFTDVLITGVDWSDGLLVNETCEFICRGFNIQYREQNVNGSLKPAVSAQWGAKTHAVVPMKGSR